MARISGVDLPRNKRMEIALTYLYGVGKFKSREILTAAYVPHWADVRTAEGPVRAIAFIVNRTHERYAGRLSDEAVADALARACGHVGSCAEYLLQTVTHLEELGIRDQRLWRLQAMVAARLTDGSGS